MNTTALTRPPAARSRAVRRSDTGDTSEHPTVGEMFAEIVPLVGGIAGEGPPVILLAGPWLVLGLMLSGPFAFLVVLVLFMVLAATALVAATAAVAAIVAAPYLLVRRLRRYRTRHAFSLVPIPSSRVVA